MALTFVHTICLGLSWGLILHVVLRVGILIDAFLPVLVSICLHSTDNGGLHLSGITHNAMELMIHVQCTNEILRPGNGDTKLRPTVQLHVFPGDDDVLG